MRPRVEKMFEATPWKVTCDLLAEKFLLDLVPWVLCLWSLIFGNSPSLFLSPSRLLLLAFLCIPLFILCAPSLSPSLSGSPSAESSVCLINLVALYMLCVFVRLSYRSQIA